MLHPRLEIFVRGAGTYVVVLVLTGFGLALAVRDGLVALLMFLVIIPAAGFLAWHLLT